MMIAIWKNIRTWLLIRTNLMYLVAVTYLSIKVTLIYKRNASKNTFIWIKNIDHSLIMKFVSVSFWKNMLLQRFMRLMRKFSAFYQNYLHKEMNCFIIFLIFLWIYETFSRYCSFFHYYYTSFTQTNLSLTPNWWN